MPRPIHEAGFDEGTRKTVQQIPLLRTRAGPRDGDQWQARLREELQALIHFVKMNKEADNDWFRIECNKTGTRWTGKCWAYHEGVKYDFTLQFEIPGTSFFAWVLTGSRCGWKGVCVI